MIDNDIGPCLVMVLLIPCNNLNRYPNLLDFYFPSVQSMYYFTLYSKNIYQFINFHHWIMRFNLTIYITRDSFQKMQILLFNYVCSLSNGKDYLLQFLLSYYQSNFQLLVNPLFTSMSNFGRLLIISKDFDIQLFVNKFFIFPQFQRAVFFDMTNLAGGLSCSHMLFTSHLMTSFICHVLVRFLTSKTLSNYVISPAII